ncbi:MAG: MBL fold metallo-hydrolase [Gemmatimonadota bacterium]|nr:MAG: MBL fold metallo-hydrolase [Gemmatimonadota bacterium]
MLRRGTVPPALCALWTLACGPLVAQEMQDVQVTATHVAGHVYLLTGRGGNIGASIGDDGVFLVDDQYAPLTEHIRAAVAAISDLPIRFVVNTHWHEDHTGGNERMGEAGAIIVAHENVRERLSTEQFVAFSDRHYDPSPAGALPVITFTDAVTFHWNGDANHAFHVENAHTDGDAVIHFREANVLHAGDVYWNGVYPFIDISSGGSIDGMIAAVDRLLELVDADTRIIPGHGPLSSVEELRTYRWMLLASRERVAALMAERKTREEIIAAGPTAEFDEAWGQWFIRPEQWVGFVYDGLAGR